MICVSVMKSFIKKEESDQQKNATDVNARSHGTEWVINHTKKKPMKRCIDMG